MLQNYIKIAIRNLLKHKGYSTINVLGLAIGLTSCLLIFLYVTDELSFDRFHEKADAIYRMDWDFKYDNNEGVGPTTPPPLAAALVSELPEVKAALRLYPVSDMTVRYEDKFFNEPNILAADPNFFEFFSFDLIAGDPETALDEPNSVILTRETARKYFGDAPALGKILTIGKEGTFFERTYTPTFKVTGIVDQIPQNSHFRFDLLTSMSSHPEVAFFDWSWFWMQVVTYTRVDDRARIPELEGKITGVVAKYAPPAFKRLGMSYDELIDSGGRWNFVFEPLTDIYLGTVGNRLGSVGNQNTVLVLMIIAGFILFIACTNSVNLATARSANRAREVGVRKVLGSVRKHLMAQFLTEAILFSVMAMVLAVGLTELLLGSFNQLSGKSLELHLLDPRWLLPALMVMTVLVGVAAGCYPALYLSRLQPVRVLKGILSPGKSQGLRNTLVVIQFAISIALIVCTAVVYKQMQFLRTTDTGFNKEGVLVVSNENQRLGDQAELFRDRLKAHTQVENATISTGVPPQWGFQDFYRSEKQSDEKIPLISYMTDENFLATLGIRLVQGRGFSRDFNESQSIILNQSAVRRFGLEQPVGKKIFYYGREYDVIGVVEDFNFATLHQPILPFALFDRSSSSYTIPNSCIAVRIRPENLSTTIHLIKKEWQTLAPASPFEYSFLDDNFEAQYRAEQRLGTLFLIFAGLAVFIACLGLLGLASFTAEKRTKEIGVRKVLGASVPNLIFMLCKTFARWVVVANILAWPSAFYFMNKWLEGFAYRTALTWDIFFMAGAAALVISVLTVMFQANRAATVNPVKALRYE